MTEWVRLFVPLLILWFWLTMFIHSLIERNSNRILWIIILVVTIVGAGPYYFAVYRKGSKKTAKIAALATIVLGIVLYSAIALIDPIVVPS
jgi:hypothetical protein